MADLLDGLGQIVDGDHFGVDFAMPMHIDNFVGAVRSGFFNQIAFGHAGGVWDSCREGDALEGLMLLFSRALSLLLLLVVGADMFDAEQETAQVIASFGLIKKMDFIEHDGGQIGEEPRPAG